MLKVLLVEDDRHLSDIIKEILEDLVDVEQVYDGDEGLYLVKEQLHDLYILDIMLPGSTGYEILAALRQVNREVPVLMLTAKDAIEDKVNGFEKGADDYLTKPFHREELRMRVQALLKRRGSAFQENTIRWGALKIDMQAHQVYFGEDVLEIVGKEYDILTYLVQNPNIIITKEQIFDRIWGFESETTMTVVEVYMSNLRKKLKFYHADKWIRTIRNVGYMMGAAE